MDEKNNGGPAFPTLDELLPTNGSYAQYKAWGNDGMTLRDYFAAKALPGLIGRRWEDDNGKVPDDIMDRWARGAYATADAMLRARDA